MQRVDVAAEFLEFAFDPCNVAKALGDLLERLRVRGGQYLAEYFADALSGIENRVSIHDLHATILHALGIDHTQLTYRYAGRDFRLTDVFGEVVKEILV